MPFLVPFIPAIVATGATLISNNSQKKAVQGAANAQVASNDAAIAEGRRQFDQTRADQLPFIQAGQTALGQQQGVLGAQSGLLGLNGAGPQAEAIAQIKASPMWQSLFGAGEDAVLANASATGGLRGGNTQRSLYEVGENTLADLIQRQLANYGALSGQYGAIAGQGAQTGASLGALGAQNATNIGNIQIGSGQARAGGILGRANLDANSLESILGTVGKIAGSLI